MLTDALQFESTEEAEEFILVILKGDEVPQSEPKTSFSIELCTSSPIQVRELRHPEPTAAFSVRGTWHKGFLGGSISSPGFPFSPQYKLSLGSPGQVAIRAQTETQVYIMLVLFRSG